MAERTITYAEPSSGAAAAAPEAQLIVALSSDHPLARPSRHLLSRVDTVLIGRGDGGAARITEAGAPALRLALADGLVSQRHATISRLNDRWVLEDAGSKNGTAVNGVPARRAILLDGDLIEIGRSLILYRDARPAVAPADPDLGSENLFAPAGLTTFVQPLAEAYDALTRVATTAASVVILGESGTGKELVARAVHDLSGRKGPFVAVNCGALPPNLVEATLFGHRKGSFSGATDDRPGIIRSSSGGTLFLDEIGDLPRSCQVAFLRVLQEQEVVPVGDTRAVKVDLRVVTATHRPLADLVDKDEFRADLYARLSGLVVRLPRLADRREDLGLIIAALLQRIDGGRNVQLTPAAARALFRHDWPLNVRELEKVLVTAVALAERNVIDVRHLGEAFTPPDAPTVDEADDRLLTELRALLVEHQGNISAVARAMGKGRTQIQRWIKRYNIETGQFRR